MKRREKIAATAAVKASATPRSKQTTTKSEKEKESQTDGNEPRVKITRPITIYSLHGNLRYMTSVEHVITHNVRTHTKIRTAANRHKMRGFYGRLLLLVLYDCSENSTHVY